MCKETVCTECAADPFRCGLPTIREWRLGLTKRLLQVDATGRYGLVRGFGSPLRGLDLRGGRWIDLAHQRSHRGQLTASRVLPSGLVLFELQKRTTRDEIDTSLGFVAHEPDGTEVMVIESEVTSDHELALSADGGVGFRSLRDETVQLVWFRHPYEVRIVNPMPGRVIQALSFDPLTRRLVTSSWGEVVLAELSDDGLRRVGRLELGAGDVDWVGVRRNTLVACIRESSQSRLVVFDLEADGRIGGERLRFAKLPTSTDFAISADGQRVAVPHRKRIRLLDLRTGAIVSLDGHTDTINCLQFTFDGDHLIAGDCDNRVRIWPLDDGGALADRAIRRGVVRTEAEAEAEAKAAAEKAAPKPPPAPTAEPTPQQSPVTEAPTRDLPVPARDPARLPKAAKLIAMNRKDESD